MKNLILSLIVVSCGLFAADEVDACRRNQGCCQQPSCCQQDNCCRPRFLLRRSINCCEQSSGCQQSSCCDSGCGQTSNDVAPAVSYDAPMMEPTPAVTEPVMYNEGSDCGCGGGGEPTTWIGEPAPMETYSSEVAMPADGGAIIESAPVETSAPVEAPAETAIPDAPVEG